MTQDATPLLFPDKVFYRIGEASRLSGIEPHVLRQWEIDFDVLKPHKTRSGQRLYTKKDLELISTIHRLLTVEGYSKQGVRAKLAQLASETSDATCANCANLRQALVAVKQKLKDILQKA